ncbi:hypothetical protein D3C71_831930 [compost metagenome]
MNTSAGAGILAFGIFADAEDVELRRLERAFHTRQQPMGADIGILHEALADRQKQAVQGYRIRHFRRPTDSAEQDGIEAPQCPDAVCRHHRTGFLVEGAGPREVRTLQAKSVLARCLLQHRPCGFGHVAADTVAGDQGYRVCVHVLHP